MSLIATRIVARVKSADFLTVECGADIVCCTLSRLDARTRARATQVTEKLREKLGTDWAVEEMTHDDSRHPCALVEKLAGVDVLLTAHGFQVPTNKDGENCCKKTACCTVEDKPEALEKQNYTSLSILYPGM